jgi:hypothetical protein
VRYGFYRRGSLRKLAHAQESPLGVELSWGGGKFLLRVGLPLGVELPEGSISQEVRPEDKMAADSQNGDIITLRTNNSKHVEKRKHIQTIGENVNYFIMKKNSLEISEKF